MYSLGLDIGSSSIKAAIIDLETGKVMAEGYYPKEEMAIHAPMQGYAEQDPETWWNYAKILLKQILVAKNVDGKRIKSIGISYQMHGLVLVDNDYNVVRPSIIWCDSRAVSIGNNAFTEIGQDYCLSHLLNSPGNFTASKLAWVNQNEPEVFNKVGKFMLPGDFIAMKLTGEISTTISGLSEGIFWDFAENRISDRVLDLYGIPKSFIPEILPTFSVQGRIRVSIAEELGIASDAVVSYRAGDQPNNAFSLNVLNAGEVAATAGTSGVVYGVIDQVKYDELCRVNQFAHLNHTQENIRLGVLLCINGTGIQNSWLRKNFASTLSYNEINQLASKIPIGSDGVSILPFGNGAERVLENKNVGSKITGLDFNRHTSAHVFRAAQEGIVFTFKYGVDIMKEMGLNINVIRAGKGNMFLSEIFRESLANITGASIELYETDGAHGAARGAAIGCGAYSSFTDAFTFLEKIEIVHPDKNSVVETEVAYKKWLSTLEKTLH